LNCSAVVFQQSPGVRRPPAYDRLDETVDQHVMLTPQRLTMLLVSEAFAIIPFFICFFSSKQHQQVLMQAKT
jgi:hypothetical protein